MKLFLLLIGVSAAAFSQSTPPNTITGSVGYARQLNAECCQADTAVSFGVTYGRRIMHYLEAEAGVTVAIIPHRKFAAKILTSDPTTGSFGFRSAYAAYFP